MNDHTEEQESNTHDEWDTTTQDSTKPEMDWPEPEQKQKPDAEPLGGCLIAAMIILAIVIPCVGPIAALIFGLVSYRRPGAVPIIIVSLIFLLIIPFLLMAAIAVPNFIKAKDKAREAEVKANIHTIQIALERYATDHSGRYPQSSSELIEFAYIGEFPGNPIAEGRPEMMDIEFGSVPFEGHFTYVPITIDNKTTDYYLLGYGTERTDGIDCDEDGKRDHVIIILSSVDPSDIFRKDKPAPDLKELLRE